MLRQIQQIATALLLLLAALIGAELWLQFTRQAPVPIVATQSDAVSQPWLAASPTQHHQMKPLTQVAADDGTVLFQTNSLGLRGPEPAIPAPQGTMRVLLLGDETVVGNWLPDEYTLSSQLQRHLSEQLRRPVEVINAGVPGFSPLLSALQFQQQLVSLNPDVVILHFDMSDVADDAVHRTSLKQEGSRPVCIHPSLNGSRAAPPAWLNLVQSSALVELLKTRVLGEPGEPLKKERYAWTRTTPGNLQAQVQHAMESVALLQHETRRHQCLFLMATAPVSWQVLPASPEQQVGQSYGINAGQAITGDIPFRVLSSWSSEAGVPFCSPVSAFRSYDTPQQLFRPDSPRLSRYGTALYAQELVRTMLRSPQVAAIRPKSLQ